MNKLFILFSSFVILHLASGITLACSCEPVIVGTTQKQLIDTAFAEAQAVFSARVLKIKHRKSTDRNPNPPVQITFKVLESWKGVKTEKIVVATDDNRYGGCGSEFEVGKSYLVYAYYWQSDKLETDQCTRTNELLDAERDLKLLGKSNAPKKAKT